MIELRQRLHNLLWLIVDRLGIERADIIGELSCRGQRGFLDGVLLSTCVAQLRAGMNFGKVAASLMSSYTT